MARSYIGSVGGFADGFTQGFGLINDAYTGKRKLDMAEEEMAYSRENDRLDREQAQKNFNAEQDAAERRFQAQQTTAKNQYNLDSQRLGIAQTEASASATLRETQAETSRRQSAAAQATIDAENRALEEERSVAAISQLSMILDRAKETGTRPDLAKVNELIDQTSGRFDITTVLGEDYQNNLANFSAAITEKLNSGKVTSEDINSDPRITKGMDSIINSGKGAMIGKTVDSTFVNAPDEYKDGKHRVISREAINIDVSEGQMQGQQGPAQLMLSSEVLVTVEDENGDHFTYIAPLTENRGSGSSEKVQIPLNTFFDGVAGSAVLVDTMNRDFAPIIKQARIEKLGGEAKFRESLNQEIKTIEDMIVAYGERRTYLSSKKNADLTADDISRLAESRVLGLGSKTETFRDAAQSQIMESKMALSSELKRFRLPDSNNNPNVVPTLSDKEALQLSATLDKNNNISQKTRELLVRIMRSKGAIQQSRGAPISDTPDIPSFSSF